MQAFISYIFIILSLVIMVTCCERKNQEADRLLDSADVLMAEHPDSALSLIEKIDTVDLDEEHFARYALLLTKARDKNYIDPADDKMIRKALDFYQGKNNSEETQALYYYGYVSYCRDSLRRSIPVISKCYNMACEQNDWFYQGMSTRLLSDIYKCLCLFQEELDYAHKAQDAFLQYEKAVSDSSHERSSWMNVYIAEALNNNKEYESVIDVCNNSDSSLMLNDSSFRHLILINKAQAYSKSGMLDSCIAIYGSLMADGYDMEAYNWCRLSESYLRKRNLAAGRQFLDSAKNNLNYRTDTLYVAMLENLIAEIGGNKDSVLRSSMHYNNILTDISNNALIGMPLSDITENYKSELSDIKSENANQTLLATLGILGLIGIIILIIWFSRKMAKKKDSKITSLSEQTELLRIDVKNLRNDNNSLCLDRLSTLEQTDELKKQIANRLKTIDEVCRLWYRMPDNKNIESSLPPAARMQLEDLRTESSLEYLDCLIDIYSDSMVDEIREINPNIRSSLLRQARYMYVGFSNETIIYLLAKKNSYALATDKNRLKNEILKGEEAKSAELLKRLNITPVKKDKQWC